MHRGGRGFQADFFAGETVTVAAPLDTLFDVEHLLSWGGSVGAVLHKVLLWEDEGLRVRVRFQCRSGQSRDRKCSACWTSDPDAAVQGSQSKARARMSPSDHQHPGNHACTAPAPNVSELESLQKVLRKMCERPPIPHHCSDGAARLCFHCQKLVFERKISEIHLF